MRRRVLVHLLLRGRSRTPIFCFRAARRLSREREFFWPFLWPRGKVKGSSFLRFRRPVSSEILCEPCFFREPASLLRRAAASPDLRAGYVDAVGVLEERSEKRGCLSCLLDNADPRSSMATGASLRFAESSDSFQIPEPLARTPRRVRVCTLADR